MGGERGARETVSAGERRAGHLSAEQWETVVAAIAARRAAGDSATAAVVAAAKLLGVGRSTVWAHLRRGCEPQQRAPRGRYVLTEADRTEIYAAAGNVAAVARARQREGAPGPTLRTLQRAVRRELSDMERVYARSGMRAAREYGLFQQLRVPHRNLEWQTDHKQLGVTVVLPDGQTGKPWITAFGDVATRVIQGWAVDLRPTETTVTCALRRSLQPTPFPDAAGLPGGEHGGVPIRMRLDNGLEFAANGLKAAADELGIELMPCPPYQPHRKGSIERWNRTLDQTLLSGLPHFDNGPKKADGSLYAAAGSMLSLAELVAEIDAWMIDYHDRPHDGLDGATPRQAWLADPTPLRVVPEEQLRGLLHRTTRTIGKYGIRINNLWYCRRTCTGCGARWRSATTCTPRPRCSSTSTASTATPPSRSRLRHRSSWRPSAPRSAAWWSRCAATGPAPRGR